MSKQKFRPATGISPRGDLSYAVHDQMVRAVGRKAADRFQRDPENTCDACLEIIAMNTPQPPLEAE